MVAGWWDPGLRFDWDDIDRFIVPKTAGSKRHEIDTRPLPITKAA